MKKFSEVVAEKLPMNEEGEVSGGGEAPVTTDTSSVATTGLERKKKKPEVSKPAAMKA